MAISKLTVENRLRPFLLAQIPLHVLSHITDTQFNEIFDEVAKDLNAAGELLVERFYKQANTTNAEESTLCNYKTQKRILRVFDFIYEDSAYEDQVWTFIAEDADGDGRLVLKTSPAEGTQLNVLYLAQCDGVSLDADEIDLPDEVLPEFMALLKERILADYGTPRRSYDEMLEYYGAKARGKVNKLETDKPLKPYWWGQGGDGALLYNITENYVSPGDNAYTDVNGDYFFYT